MNKNKVIRAVAAAGAVSVVPSPSPARPRPAPRAAPTTATAGCASVRRSTTTTTTTSYWGDYSIRDSKQRRWDFSLGGRSYDCFTTKVKTGWTKVSVTDYPNHVYTNKHQQDSYWFKVKKGYTYTVTFRFDSYDYKHAPQQVALRPEVQAHRQGCRPLMVSGRHTCLSVVRVRPRGRPSARRAPRR